MIEIRAHGRGGMGAVTMMELLAIAAFKDGKYSQAFSSFGVERTGSPTTAFCRIDNKFINLRTHVYTPGYLIILDDTLLNILDVTNGLSKTGMIIINSKKKLRIDGFKIFCVDATQIALDMLGKPVVNTAMLGAFSKATGLVRLESIKSAVKERFEGELGEKNVKAIELAYERTK